MSRYGGRVGASATVGAAAPRTVARSRAAHGLGGGEARVGRGLKPGDDRPGRRSRLEAVMPPSTSSRAYSGSVAVSSVVRSDSYESEIGPRETSTPGVDGHVAGVDPDVPLVGRPRSRPRPRRRRRRRPAGRRARASDAVGAGDRSAARRRRRPRPVDVLVDVRRCWSAGGAGPRPHRRRGRRTGGEHGGGGGAGLADGTDQHPARARGWPRPASRRARPRRPTRPRRRRRR